MESKPNINVLFWILSLIVLSKSCDLNPNLLIYFFIALFIFIMNQLLIIV